MNVFNKRELCKNLFDVSDMLKKRGIGVWWSSGTCSYIKGRLNEPCIYCMPNHIVEKDDIPEGYEVIYVYKNSMTGAYDLSYEDPACGYERLIAIIYKKRYRRTGVLIPVPKYFNVLLSYIDRAEAYERKILNISK